MLKKFNIRYVLTILGKILLMEAAFMSTSLVWAFYYDEATVLPFVASVAILLFASLLLHLFSIGNKNKEFSTSDAYLIMVLSWVATCTFGAFPYLLSETTTSIVDALFETISGFSTTGATIFTDVEVLPKSILWWRNLTHWMGGMGILLLVVAILPYLKVTGLQLFTSGSSSIVSEKLNPRIHESARRLWGIYVSLTCLECILLYFGDMGVFESITHSFSTVSTGGFSIKNNSLAGYSTYSQYVVSIFMLFSGINFVIFYHFLKGNIKRVFHDEELRYYLVIIFTGTALVSCFLAVKSHLPFEESFRAAFFQVASTLSTTGLTTTNYLLWPSLCVAVIFFLMFFGACSGSAGGGIKIVRCVLSFKVFKKIILRLYHPKAILSLSLNDKKIEDNVTLPVIGFVLLYMFTFIACSLALTACNIDLNTSMGASISAMSGVGPGIGNVGPSGTFTSIPVMGKCILSVAMILGRLELLPVFIMFSKGFWKN